jgi:hypothetical protein
LAFGDERHAIALLMNSQIAAVAEYYSIGVLAVSVVAYRAFAIRLVARRVWVTIHGRLRT